MDNYRIRRSLSEIQRTYYSIKSDAKAYKILYKNTTRNIGGIFMIFGICLLVSCVMFQAIIDLLLTKTNVPNINDFVKMILIFVGFLIINFVISSYIFRVVFYLFHKITKNQEDEDCYTIALQETDYILTFVIGTLLATIIGLTSLVYAFIDSSTPPENAFGFKCLFSGTLYMIFALATTLKLVIKRELDDMASNNKGKC